MFQHLLWSLCIRVGHTDLEPQPCSPGQHSVLKSGDRGSPSVALRNHRDLEQHPLVPATVQGEPGECWAPPGNVPVTSKGCQQLGAARGLQQQLGSCPGPVRPSSMGRDGKAKGLFPHASTTFLPILLTQDRQEQVILVPQNAWTAPAQPHLSPTSLLSTPSPGVPSAAGTNKPQAVWFGVAVVSPHSQRYVRASKLNSGLC